MQNEKDEYKMLKVKKDEKDEIDVKDVQLRIGWEGREG